MNVAPDASSPLRIAHVAGQLETGGMERLLVEFARYADRERFALHFISLGGRGTVADEIEACGWRVTTLDRPRGVQPGMVGRLPGLFRRLRIDVVHTHNVRPLVYGAPAARLARVGSVVHTRHGQSVRGLAGFRLSARLVDRVVSVSEAGTRLSAEQGVPRVKLRTVRNGIDLSRFAYAGPQAGGPAVMVGRLSPEKDPFNLVRAAAIACAVEPWFRVEVAGAGPCMGALVELTRQLGLHERIRFHGEVADVAGLLAGASQFVLPSLSEGISLGLLEAMARGLPVVATRVGGTPEVIEHGVSGLLVSAVSPGELAAAMLQVHRDPLAARVMGRAAHERVCAHFDVRRMVAEYEGLYHECAGARRVLRKRAA